MAFKRNSVRKMRFIGTVEAKVDEKGRAFLPALFRRQLNGDEGQRLIMRKDVFESCLVIYPEEVWARHLDELHEKLSVWSRSEQDLFRRFVADVEWLSLDSNGRFLIPRRYLKMAGISQSVTFIGMDHTIEIWGKEVKEEKERESGDFGEALEKLMTRE